MTYEKQCTSCGSLTPADSVFCITCGARIVQQDQSAPVYADPSQPSGYQVEQSRNDVFPYNRQSSSVYESPSTPMHPPEPQVNYSYEPSMHYNYQPQPQQSPTAVYIADRKNPGAAAVLSFFWTGLGQIYNGQILKGIALMVIQVINFFLIFVLIGFVTFPLVWALGIWDAYTTADSYNKRSLQPF